MFTYFPIFPFKILKLLLLTEVTSKKKPWRKIYETYAFIYIQYIQPNLFSNIRCNIYSKASQSGKCL